MQLPLKLQISYYQNHEKFTTDCDALFKIRHSINFHVPYKFSFHPLLLPPLLPHLFQCRKYLRGIFETVTKPKRNTTTSLTEKTRMYNHLQMSWQRQHILLTYFKTPSVGSVWGLEPSTSCMAVQRSTAINWPIAVWSVYLPRIHSLAIQTLSDQTHNTRFFWSFTYNDQIDWYKILSIAKASFLSTFLSLKYRVHSDSSFTDIVQKIVFWEN